jgi:hypothetical protein
MLVVPASLAGELPPSLAPAGVAASPPLVVVGEDVPPVLGEALPL